MTTVITRLYADGKTAEQAVTALKLQNHPDDNIDTVSSGSGAQDAMTTAGVPENSAAAYAKAMTSGSALVVVRAPVTPFGAARNAMDTLDQFDSVDAGVANQNVYIETAPSGDMLMELKVDRTHRHWATWGNERRRGRVSDAFGVKCLSPYKTSRSAYSGTKFFGSFLLPPISKRKPRGDSVFSGTKHFGNFLVPLISRSGPQADVSKASEAGPVSNAR